MNGSIYTATSGLIAYQTALGAVSNNIANVNTTGYKADRVSFQDLMYQNNTGKGTTVDDSLKDFSQGTLQTTDVQYDFAVKGDGFFTVQDPLDNAIYYTRAGNFDRDTSNYLVDANDMNVQGLLPDITGDTITEDFTKNISNTILEDDTSIISSNTFTTNYAATATQSGVSGTEYKSASSNISDITALETAYASAMVSYSNNMEEGEIASTAVDTVTFPLSTDGDGSYNISITVNGKTYEQNFDTDIATTLNNLSDSINESVGVNSSVDTVTGELTISSLIAGESLQTQNAKVNESNLTVTALATQSGSGQNLVDAIYTQLQTLIQANGGDIATIKSEITKTQSGGIPNTGDISLDLVSLDISDSLDGDLVNDNGNIYLKQGEASFLIGRIETVSFIENSSLRAEGDNLYSETADSGDPMYIANKAQVVSGTLEYSSTDLSEGLVNLMLFQKAFEANSKVVTTSDDMLQTALGLKNK